MKRNVGILVFDDAEVLDFAGPFEVFSVASEVHDFKLFNTFIVAKHKKPIRAVNGLSVNPNYDFTDVPKIDILIIAGGNGTRDLMQDKDLLQWVDKVHTTTEFTLSICSGSRVLGKLELLDEQAYCTHHQVYDYMKDQVPTGLPQPEKRFVQAGKIFTSGGISAGIDLSFALVEKLHGRQAVEDTARYMEYELSRG